MDNPLTPKKIERLIHLAEDRSFNVDRRLLLTEEDVKLIVSHSAGMSKSYANCESSSGILDLERVEGFGESGLGNISLSKSTAFNPGEMTGRSTGADEATSAASLAPPRPDEYRRYSLALDSLTTQLDKQTSEINDIMRHSIASNYSFHSKRDLTADEASLIVREAPLPVQQSTYANITESAINSSNLSVGAYFQNRCPEFGKILSKTDSPDKSNLMPSITEVSSCAKFEASKDTHQVFSVDDSLDCVPVRQPRNANAAPSPSKIFQKPHLPKEAIPGAKLHDKNTEATGSKIPVRPVNYNNSVFCSKKSFMTSSKPADLVLKNLHSSIRLMNEDTEASVENSFSISKIADYLGKQSNVSVSDILQLNQKKNSNKKQPLTEIHMNTQMRPSLEDQVTSLKDSKRTETASSAGTTNTVICFDKLTIADDIPKVIVTQPTLVQDDVHMESEDKTKHTTRSKSPSSRSQSTFSTVRDNYNSFKSGDSPVHSNEGEANRSKVPSPNVEYKELDKSVDWREILQQKRLKQEGLAKEQWAEIVATPVDGFVGVITPVTITVTTLTDSWLTAKLQFDNLPNDGKDLSYELPRLPLLLSPRKSEQFALYLTSNVEINTTLSFTIYLKDTSIDGEYPVKGDLHVNFKLPMIQAMSSDGMNKITFPPVPEQASVHKAFVLLNECTVDLQLKLFVTEGDSMFSIISVQEIKKSDVNKVLTERPGTSEEQMGKTKNKAKQLCRLTCGNAIKVTIAFNSPKLSELQLTETKATFNGVLNVNLIGTDIVLKTVDLIGSVGSTKLVVDVSENKLCLSNDPKIVNVTNTGSVPGVWIVKFKINASTLPFKISPAKFELHPGDTKAITMSYCGSDDNVTEASLIFEDNTGNRTTLEIVGGVEKPKSFPIKTNHNNMSWVRAGRKEISLKSSIDKKTHIRCQIVGEGFSIDLPGVESRGIIVPFSSYERRSLPIVFTPSSCMPHSATLHLVYDKNSDYSRKVKLYGCASGEGVRWSGQVTCGNTALVRAVSRAPIDLKLYNKSNMPSFVAARVHFNLQYMSVEQWSCVSGSRRVVAGRSVHTVSLRVDWARVERRARECATPALATITILTGAEFTRRRILKILRDDSKGQIDTSLLPDHLKVLTDHFEGEDPTADTFLTEFNETKTSLNELIGGLQELTAQVDLPQDFADENNTIIITDDTVIDHHTLCE